MYYVILVIHLLIALLLGVVVLLQRSKGNGLAGAFGGVGAGEAMFGTHGVTTMLHKATIYLAIAFMVTSLGLVYLTAQRSDLPSASAARSTSGERVLPVGSADVAAPSDAAGVTTIPEGTEDSVVPVDPGSDAVVPAEGNDTPTEKGTEEGGR